MPWADRLLLTAACKAVRFNRSVVLPGTASLYKTNRRVHGRLCIPEHFCKGVVLLVISTLLFIENTRVLAQQSTIQTPQLLLTLMDRPEITNVLFHPVQVARNTPPQGAVDIDVSVAEDVTIACRLYSADPTAPTIVFFHGNGEIIPDYDTIGPMYVRERLNFLVTEYRGYGWSTGMPLTSTLLPDSNTVFLSLRQWLSDHAYTGPLFVMGRSLGSACAIDVAVNHSELVDGLIIESGFAKTLPLAVVLGVDLAQLGISEEQTFNNSAKIATFTKPTYILHGQYDQLIQLWQAETLHAQCDAKQKELQVVPRADHNSIIAVAGPLYFQEIRKFIEKATGTAPDWRELRRQFKARQKQAAENHDR
ncbi:alpha/beta hydrolase [Desulfobulbus oligotrophicus]|nr:alpha/beta hydrolase [Desulfobulbus oligotrophicus]